MNPRLSNLSSASFLVAAFVVALLSITTYASAQATDRIQGTSSEAFIRDGIGFGYTSASLVQGGLNRGGIGSSGSFRGSNNSMGFTLSGGPTAIKKSRPATKPFAGKHSRPTVSPYLGLFNNGLLGDEIQNYNTIVRPQLRQQRINQQFEQQAQALNRQFQQAVAQPAYNPQGSERMMATGHRTLFNYTSHFYPSRAQ